MSFSFSAVNAGLVLLAPVVSGFLSLALIRPARHFGLLDHPAGRKAHEQVTPLVGGLGIFLAFVGLNAAIGSVPGQSLSLLAAMLVTVVIGVLDDAHEIGYRSKFFAQLAAALILVSGTTVHMTHFGNLLGLGPIELGKWTVLVTVMSIVGVMNATNMIDGADGLAGSALLPPVLAYALVAASGGQGRVSSELLLLGWRDRGFSGLQSAHPWLSRALVFLGDAGGLLLGLLLAWYSMVLSGRPGAPLSPIEAVWIMGVPLLDMGSVMLLRISQRRSPFFGDRQHMHYVLLDGGYSVNQVVAMMATASATLGLATLVARELAVPEVALFAAFLALWGGWLVALARPKQTLRLLKKAIAPASGALASEEA
ncbi:MAG: undecaprenyl/decaprenyl-phosphate alpha-N-acetylglucosaminyl 1-phosphate transferase [Burkholderiales bacterium]|nr:undecaprenyl/decaprenyl-phosphate alpha-N-acetylglucosaminyl 1-phosphate transferase [Burkholderiales bacterium]